MKLEMNNFIILVAMIPSEKIKEIISRIKKGESIKSVLKTTDMPYSMFRKEIKNAGIDYGKLKEKCRESKLENKFEKVLELAKKKNSLPNLKEIQMDGSLTAEVRRNFKQRLMALGYSKQENKNAQRLLESFKQGNSLKDIAKAERITKERVRQILSSTGEYHKERERIKKERSDSYFETALLNTMELGHIPNHKEYKLLNVPFHFYSSIRKKLRKKGFHAIRKPYSQKYSEQFLLDELKRIEKIVKRTPAINDIKKFGKVSFVLYFKRFGSMKAAQLQAGFEPNKRGAQKFVSQELLLADLKRISKLLKKTLSLRDINKHSAYSAVSYYKYFGSLIKAQKKAGLRSHKSGRPSQKSCSVF